MISSEVGQVQFVSDETVNLDEKDPLGTKAYSDSIYNIILNKSDSKPMTIGLFGSWGSGKSSIVETVRDKLNKNSNKKIGVMYYDAWKYSNDAFRRSFILELKREFKLDMDKDLETFYQDKTEEIDHSVGFKKSWLLNTMFVLVPIIGFTSYIVFKSIMQNIPLSESVFIAILGGYITLMSYMIKESLIEYKISISKPRVFSPEQFEEIFKNAINALTLKENFILKWFKERIGKRKYKEILIIIDNIDRCHKDLSMELILTIKNFLEVENCIFLIPVDDEALKEQLGYKNSEGEEFLRKFFNITLRIKKFTPRNLREYTKKLIDENKIMFSHIVADMISQEFSKNPRRIKQFINNLYAEYLIASAQEDNGEISKGSISNNIEYLAKILVIKEEWPELYKLIDEYPAIINNIEKNIKENKFGKDSNNSNLYITDGIEGFEKITLTKVQYLFFRRNLNITTLNVETFLRLKDININIPNILINYINDGDWEEIKKIVLQEKTTISKVIELIYLEYDLTVNKLGLYDTAGFNLINLFFQITNDETCANIFEDVYLSSKMMLDDIRILNVMDNLNFEQVLSYSQKLTVKGESFLRHNIVIYLNKVRDVEKIQDYINTYSNDIDSLSRIKDIVSSVVELDTNNSGVIVDLVNNENQAKALFSNKTIETIIGKIVNSTDAKNIALVECIKRLNKFSIISKKARETFLQKVMPFASPNDLNSMKFWLESLENMFVGLDKSTIKTSIYQYLQGYFNTFFNQFVSGYRDETRININLKLINLFKEYYVYIDKNNQNAIDSIVSYLNRNENKDMYLEANKALGEIINHFGTYNWSFLDTLCNRVNSLGNIDDKLEIIKTLIIQLQKVKYDQNEYKGVSVGQINNICNLIFDLYFTNPDKFGQCIVEVLNIESIRPQVELRIRAISNVNQQQKILEVSSSIKNKEIVQALVTNIVSNSKDYTLL